MIVVYLICWGVVYFPCSFFFLMWYVFVSLFHPTPPHEVHFLWPHKNRRIVEARNVLLWEWKLEFSHPGFYSLVSYRSPKLSSKVRIILCVIFVITTFFEIHSQERKLLKYIRQSFRTVYLFSVLPVNENLYLHPNSSG